MVRHSVCEVSTCTNEAEMALVVSTGTSLLSVKLMCSRLSTGAAIVDGLLEPYCEVEVVAAITRIGI